MSVDYGICRICNGPIHYSYKPKPNDKWLHSDQPNDPGYLRDDDHEAKPLLTEPNEVELGPSKPVATPSPDPLITAVLDAANATLRREFGRMVEAHVELFSEAPIGWRMPALSRGEVRAVLGAFLALEVAGELDRLVGEGEVGNG